MQEVKLDRRVRRFSDVERVDAADWFVNTLPHLLDKHGAAAAAVQRLGLAPLSWDVEGTRGGLTLCDGRLVATSSQEGLQVKLTAHGFSDWVNQIRNVQALSLTGDVSFAGGSLEELLTWQLVLHALTGGTLLHEPGSITFEDRHGAPLNLEQKFGPDDDPADIAHFIREAGYVHLRGWLAAETMATIAADMDRAVSSYRPDDGRSWWARLDTGDEVCTRMRYFVEHSPTSAALLESDAWNRVRLAIAGDEELVRTPVAGNVIEALFKPLGVVRGLSDLPWHRDCALGGHLYKCSGVVVGISITPGERTSGLLRAVAGSHRAATLDDPDWEGIDLPVVPLVTHVGDVTAHLSCTIHEALPPVTHDRKVMYTFFGLPDNGDVRGQDTVANRDTRNEAVKLVSQPPNASRG